jgi:hypothetical protein
MRKKFSAKRMRNGLLAPAVALAFVSLVPGADARTARIDLSPPTSPFGNTSFGSVGQYEQIDGTAYGEIDPRDPLKCELLYLQHPGPVGGASALGRDG